MSEFTTVLIMPDVVRRGLVSDVVGRFERRGFAVIGLKMLNVTRSVAESRYAGQPDAATRAAALVEGPCVCVVVYGASAVSTALAMAGDSLAPLTCAPGTIRGDLGSGSSSCVVEPAADADGARADATRWFGASELTEPVLHKSIKLVDKIAHWVSENGTRPFISFEYFPPKTADGVAKLRQTLALMAQQRPLFLDFTWGAGGSTSELTIELCADAYAAHDIEVNMHLTCTNQAPALCGEALAEAKRKGIRNIVALRGDPPKGQEKWEAVAGGFSCALDLVKYTRQQFGDWFGIQVSGYPEGHPDVIKPVAELGRPLSASEQKRLVTVGSGASAEQFVCSDADFDRELGYLKQKCDAGADCVITQMFFDFEVFEAFVTQARAKGISAPILPGIMLITAYGGFTRMTGFCKSRVPAELVAKAEALKEDAEGFKEMGLSWTVALCKQLVASQLVPGLHFYTLNQSANTQQILQRLGLLLEQPTEALDEGDTLKGTHIA
ncbi:hypothetical protein KFE25_005746 [Diacronema lutheri]|uniref:Nucleoside diphosphate kinase-like domain-containing protein n=1 Tax=Diacronema lutheri TaxID=2081491 RepID=A0A8J5XH89_DIALT|nr:hypothetical protein KFE25_005746 [Diacronema lutheri]